MSDRVDSERKRASMVYQPPNLLASELYDEEMAEDTADNSDDSISMSVAAHSVSASYRADRPRRMSKQSHATEMSGVSPKDAGSSTLLPTVLVDWLRNSGVSLTRRFCVILAPLFVLALLFAALCIGYFVRTKFDSDTIVDASHNLGLLYEHSLIVQEELIAAGAMANSAAHDPGGTARLQAAHTRIEHLLDGSTAALSGRRLMATMAPNLTAAQRIGALLDYGILMAAAPALPVNSITDALAEGSIRRGGQRPVTQTLQATLSIQSGVYLAAALAYLQVDALTGGGMTDGGMHDGGMHDGGMTDGGMHDGGTVSVHILGMMLARLAEGARRREMVFSGGLPYHSVTEHHGGEVHDPEHADEERQEANRATKEKVGIVHDEAQQQEHRFIGVIVGFGVGSAIIAALSAKGLRSVMQMLDKQQLDMTSELETHRMMEKAVAQFVPRQFLLLLDYSTLSQVRVGDCCTKQITILFAGVREFALLSADWSNEQVFDWLNKFFGRMTPVIRRSNGFVDKYVGDTIMAVFTEAHNGVQASVSLQRELSRLNRNTLRKDPTMTAVRMGVGVHTGEVVLGTLGDELRVEATIVSDAVNLASRVEGLTKYYGARVLVTDAAIQASEVLIGVPMRSLGRARPKGTSGAVGLFDVYQADDEMVRQYKKEVNSVFQKGLHAYAKRDWAGAREHFDACSRKSQQWYEEEFGESGDLAVAVKLNFIQLYLDSPPPSDWTGEDMWQKK